MPDDPPTWFGDDEIVIDLALNVGEVELAAAVDRCMPLITELRPAALELAPADPDGGVSGYHVSLIVVSRPPADGPPDVPALRREADRLTSRFGLPEGSIESTDTAYGPQLAYAGSGHSLQPRIRTMIGHTTLARQLTAEGQRPPAQRVTFSRQRGRVGVEPTTSRFAGQR